MSKISAAEKIFCQNFAETHDLKTAAVRAGLNSGNGAAAALPLLERSEIRREISRWEKIRRSREAEIVAGMRRLAFGSVSDAVRLMLSDEAPAVAELECMDFFNISEIKRQKNGGLEIKFFDRLKALELLAEHAGESGGALSGFLKALSAGEKVSKPIPEDSRG
jgi:hypothetical protein